MTLGETNWIGIAVAVCKEAAAQGVSVTITRTINSSTGIDETKMEASAWPGSGTSQGLVIEEISK